MSVMLRKPLCLIARMLSPLLANLHPPCLVLELPFQDPWHVASILSEESSAAPRVRLLYMIEVALRIEPHRCRFCLISTHPALAPVVARESKREAITMSRALR